MKIISVFNQKGGVGKTTSVVNLAVALKTLGKNVLVIDIDPQANTTSGLGLDKYNIEDSLYELFYAGNQSYDQEDFLSDDQEDKAKEPSISDDPVSKEENKADDIDEQDMSSETSNDIKVDISKYISSTNSGVDVIASEAALSGLEVELVDLDPVERTRQLKGLLTDVEGYDYIFIDCPPSLGLLSINALVASNSIIIPVQSEYYALEGISELMNTFNLVKQQLNPDLEIEGVLLTMFDKRTFLSYEVVEEVKSYFNTKVFKYMIPRNPRLAEAPSHGLSTIEYDIKSQGASAYLALAKELINKESESKNEQ